MFRRTSSRSPRTSCPATSARPALGRTSVHSMLIVVALPAPLGPRKPNVSPGWTSKSMPRTASTSSKRLTRPCTRIAGPPAPGPSAGGSRSPRALAGPVCEIAMQPRLVAEMAPAGGDHGGAGAGNRGHDLLVAHPAARLDDPPHTRPPRPPGPLREGGEGGGRQHRG